MEWEVWRCGDYLGKAGMKQEPGQARDAGEGFWGALRRKNRSWDGDFGVRKKVLGACVVVQPVQEHPSLLGCGLWIWDFEF